MACGISPDQGSNLCLLHWQVDSSLLGHLGSPVIQFSMTQISLWPLWGQSTLVNIAEVWRSLSQKLFQINRVWKICLEGKDRSVRFCTLAIHRRDDNQLFPWESSESRSVWTPTEKGDADNREQRVDLAWRASQEGFAIGTSPHLQAFPLWAETKYSNLIPRTLCEIYFDNCKSQQAPVSLLWKSFYERLLAPSCAAFCLKGLLFQLFSQTQREKEANTLTFGFPPFMLFFFPLWFYFLDTENSFRFLSHKRQKH